MVFTDKLQQFLLYKTKKQVALSHPNLGFAMLPE